MSKAVMISIRPEWCEKIASGQKTIEVRKTRPKIETPFKCYIYETKAINHQKIIVDLDGNRATVYAKGMGKIIGEFICDNVGLYKYGGAFSEKRMCVSLRVCSGLSIDELRKYAYGKDVYGWHISDLLIYDKPKELNEFMKPCPIDHNCFDCIYHHPWFDKNGKCEFKNISGAISRPPQSWCYVEEL